MIQNVNIAFVIFQIIQDVKSLLIEAEWHIYASINYPSLVQIMACDLIGAKPLSEPMLEYC